MEIEYEVTRDDCRRFRTYVTGEPARRPFFLSTWLLFAAILIFVGVLLGCLADLDGPADVAAYIVGYLLVFVLPALVIAGIVRLIGSARRGSDGKTGTLGQHSLRLADDGVYETTSAGTRFVAWSALASIGEDDHNVYLFVDRLLAHVVPKRSFSGPDHLTQFVATAESHWSAARHA